jgi:hypothetical protein
MAADRKLFWRRLRLVFRWCRIGLLLVLLGLLAVLIYLNQSGVPDFLKRRLQAGLRTRGVDLEFARLRWAWHRGFVADSVRLSSAAQPDGPQLQLGEVGLRVELRALARLALQVRALDLRGGRLVWPLHESQAAPVALTLEQINTELRFLPNDQWELDAFTARFLDATIRLAGTVTNASAWAQTRAAAGTNQPSAALWRAQARQFVQVCEQLRFTAAPDLSLKFGGDARDLSTFRAELRCRAAGAQTPWGSLKNVSLTGELNQHPATNGWFRTELRLNVEDGETPWARVSESLFVVRVAQSITNPLPAEIFWEVKAAGAKAGGVEFPSAELNARSTPLPSEPPHWRTTFTLTANQAKSQWGQSRSSHLSGSWVHSPTNLTPIQAEAKVQLAQVRVPWGEVRSVEIVSRLADAERPSPGPQADWGWWSTLAPYQVEADVQVAQITLPKLHLDHLAAGLRWQAPHCSLTNLVADLYGGRWEIPDARLDVATRELTARSVLNFDLRQLGSLWHTNAHSWLEQLAWSKPPVARLFAQLALPNWTNAHPDWRAQLWPNLWLAGEMHGEHLAFHEQPVTAFQLAFTGANSVWRLSHLRVVRPEGEAQVTGTWDWKKRTYGARVRSQLDPRAIRPLLSPAAQRGLDQFAFTGPPAIDAEVWGDGSAPGQIGLSARVVATDFTLRGERADDFRADLRLTNQFLLATDVQVSHGAEWIKAPAVGLSLTNYWVFLTNAQSQMDPLRIARAIGPRVAATISPYRFGKPPQARVNGHVPARGSTDTADLRFDLSGGPFQYWRFNLPRLTSTVHWQGDFVTITNLQAEFYRGRLAGDLAVDFSRGPSGDFQFQARAQDADLHLLMADLTTPTNRLEGMVDAHLKITHANTGDWDSWHGYGTVSMRDGLLWDWPLFGLFSPLLNSIAPGLGSSRAKAAKASYALVRSVIRTEDMEISSPPVRLRYRGTVDFHGQVRARVEALVLRGTPLIGPLISFALSPLSKVFEYQVSGTLGEPKSEPLHIPKFIDSLLHPFRTIKGLLPTEPDQPKPANPPASGAP